MDHKDMIGGAMLIVVGVSAVAYSLATLSLGTISRMGPGMAPVVLGTILAAMGVGIVGTAFGRTGRLPPFDLRSFVAVGAGILVFGLMVAPFGLVPAIFGLTIVASRADSKLSARAVVLSAAAFSLGAVLIFRIGLGLHVAIAAWPW